MIFYSKGYYITTLQITRSINSGISSNHVQDPSTFLFLNSYKLTIWCWSHNLNFFSLRSQTLCAWECTKSYKISWLEADKTLDSTAVFEILNFGCMISSQIELHQDKVAGLLPNEFQDFAKKKKKKGKRTQKN